jgi:ABC-2 type transport system ATP-binding protein
MTTTPAQPATARPDARDKQAAVVSAHELSKVFKDFWMRDRVRAVDGITFQIGRGEVFGLLGPNGSGKSTTIKMILGLLKKTSGRLLVFGKSPFEVDIKKRIGYLPEESYLYPFLTARETLDYYAKLFKLDSRTRKRRVDELLEMVGLTQVQHRQVREFSKGMQRRIGLGQALINDPEFLILDEPTTGLDPIGTKQVKELIIQLGERGKTILLSSHLLADVEDCVDRMVILYGGKIREEGERDQLLRSNEKTVVQTERLDEETIDAIRRVLEEHKKKLDTVEAPRQRLEELFMAIVDRARAEKVATSGAVTSSGTASFLRGEDAEDQARALLEQLTAEEPEHRPEAERAMPVETRARRAEEAQAEAADSVIEELMQEREAPSDAVSPAEAAPERKTQRPAPAPSQPSPDDDRVDEDVISSLLKSDDDDEDKRSERDSR